MSTKQHCRISLPISIDCDEDYDCGEDIGSSECCEALLAGQERIISGQDQIIKLLSQMKDCVCDCGGGVTPDPGYTGEAIGVILPESGRKSGTSLYRIDKDIENVDSVSADYFNKHPLWSGIVPEVIDGQAMIKVPAFAYKRGVAASGSNAGKKYLLLAPADTKEPGFERHPAFMKDGQPIDYFWVGAYQACVDPADTNKLGSVAGTMPAHTQLFQNLLLKSQNRNTGAVSGFMMWSIYQLAAIQMLFTVEHASVDSQASIAAGYTTGSAVVAVDNPTVASASYRGIVGLWGNIWQMVDGIRTAASNTIDVWNRDGTQQYVTSNTVTPMQVLSGAGVYPITMKDSNGTGYNFCDIFIPETVTGTSTAAMYPDGYWGGIAGCMFLTGGYYARDKGGNPKTSGIFSSNFAALANTAYAGTGTRIAKV